MSARLKQTELTDSLHVYLQSVSLREPEALQGLRDATLASAAAGPHAGMQVGPEQGQFLALLVQLADARKLLEIGTFTGYSALWLALALPDDGKLIACDISDEFTRVGRPFWEEAGVAHKIDLRLGPAVESLDALLEAREGSSFDFAFIDADKTNYDAYYERVLQLVRTGGLIVFDNVLWHGKIIDDSVNDADTLALRALNAKIHADPRVSISMLPLGDGMTLAVKR